MEAKRALTVSNGDVQEALDILFFERERERSTTTADQLAKSASQFGISVFKNAKYVLNASKKKVEKILEKTIAPTSQYDQQPNDSWNSPVFKDEVPGNTVQKLSAQTHSPNLHPSVKNNFSYPVQTSSKPYMPTDLYSSADTFEIQLQSTFAPTPKKVETADLLIMDTSQGITTQQPETSWSIFDEPVTEASRPITQTSNVPGPNTTKVFPTPKNGIDPTKKQPQISSIPISKERARGNELFKQGQFGDAEKEYTKAIENLPPSHPELIILYNNRGACRIKIGDNKNAVNDCDQVLLVQPNDAKARLRRATAYEALENWVKAQEDYRFLMGLDSTILGVSTGLARCTAALNLESQRQQKPKPAVPKQSSKFVKEAVNEAVKKHRDKNDQVEREVNERFKQHDIVTDRVIVINR